MIAVVVDALFLHRRRIRLPNVDSHPVAICSYTLLAEGSMSGRSVRGWLCARWEMGHVVST